MRNDPIKQAIANIAKRPFYAGESITQELERMGHNARMVDGGYELFTDEPLNVILRVKSPHQGPRYFEVRVKEIM